MSIDHSKLLAELTQFETDVWDVLVNGDRDADEKALHENFLGVYTDGFAGKQDHVAQLADGPTVQAYDLSDLAARPLGTEHALLSYKVQFLRASRSIFEVMYVSSIWQREGSGWVNIFSQDTPRST